MQTDEYELITQSLAQNANAYGELVDRYKKAIYYHCFVLLHDEDKAEDIAQETFITAYYKLTSYDRSRKFSTWLFKIATNKCLNEMKHSKRTLNVDDEYFDTQHSHEQLLRADDTQDVHTAISKLRPEYQTIVKLYYFQGSSYEDISETTGKPIGTIKAWMNRAKRELRKELV